MKHLVLRVAERLNRLGHSIGRRCLACGRSLHPEERRRECCAACAAALQPRTSGYCPLCGSIYGEEDEPPGLCLECQTRGRPWDGFGFHHAYQGLLRELLLDLKFRGELGYGRLLSGLLASAFERHLGRSCFDLVIPVPMHESRLRSRGFNQSLEIARGLAKRQGTALACRALLRTKNTQPQTGLSRKERQHNLRGAFQAVEPDVAGRNVLLVDDIYTTGATLKACVAALRKAGAQGVSVLVLARAQENW